MPGEKILLVFSDAKVGQLIEKSALRPTGYDVTFIQDLDYADSIIMVNPPDLLITGDQVSGVDGLAWVKSLHDKLPALPVILLADQETKLSLADAFRQGVTDVLALPIKINELLASVRRCLERSKRLQDWLRLEWTRNTKTLQARLNELETLGRIGKMVTASLDLEQVLAKVVDTAVELSGAEEGSLLLLDEKTGELYMRAARNFKEDFVRTFRIPVSDTLAGQCVQTGKPVMIDQKTPEKIKTSYLVHTLIYVPLHVHDKVIGVLGVDNRSTGHVFLDHHLPLISAMADYAAIAIENARLYFNTEIERTKLETILKDMDEAVIVTDEANNIILINPTAQHAFGMAESELEGVKIHEVVKHSELLEIFDNAKPGVSQHSELTLEDGRIFNATLTPIPKIGKTLTMQDITHLKELDRIKSDFVNTVSHDLRSPLTAILGYADLIERIGPVTDMQREFIRRVQSSVNNITSLINDLLDLGKIEAGFDTLKETISLSDIVHYSVDGLIVRLSDADQRLTLALDESLKVLGNPIRLRQMVSNLVHNAMKYSGQGGEIQVRLLDESHQAVMQVQDNGPGIPLSDQPYIFDKFYRASNVPTDVQGTGLGLAIVKSIVENHQGRIWVDSAPGQGTTFTVVLPRVTEVGKAKKKI